MRVLNKTLKSIDPPNVLQVTLEHTRQERDSIHGPSSASFSNSRLLFDLYISTELSGKKKDTLDFKKCVSKVMGH